MQIHHLSRNAGPIRAACAALVIATLAGGTASARQPRPAGVARTRPRPVVTVGDFTNDVANVTWFHGSVGRDLASVLGNELDATGDFRVVERRKLPAIITEQDLAASGRVRAGSGPTSGDITGATYLVTGTVSAYDEQTADTGGGLSFHGLHIGGRRSEAYVAIDLRVIDTDTSEVVYAHTVEGRSTDHGVRAGGYAGWGVGGDFHHERKTPVAKAVRAALIEAVGYLDCVMVKRDSCIAGYQRKERRRKESSGDVLDLD